MGKLKPCPFCGGKVTLAHGTAACSYGAVLFKVGRHGTEEAIKAWNTHAEPKKEKLDA